MAEALETIDKPIALDQGCLLHALSQELDAAATRGIQGLNPGVEDRLAILGVPVRPWFKPFGAGLAQLPSQGSDPV